MIEFTVNGKQYKLQKLTAHQLSEAEFRYATMYNKCLKNGILTRDKMLQMIIDNELIDKETLNQQEQIQKDIIDLEAKIQKTTNKKKQIKLAKELWIKRQTLFLIISRINTLLENTAEAMADEEKVKYSVFCSLVDEDGNAVFDSYDDFVNSDSPVVFEAISKFLFHRAGVDKGIQTIENNILKENKLLSEDNILLNEDGKMIDLNDNLIDKNYRLVDKDGYLINNNGEYVDDRGNIVPEHNKVKGQIT